jgi:hypothetical protein
MVRESATSSYVKYWFWILNYVQIKF